jgi:hypothetical protein
MRTRIKSPATRKLVKTGLKMMKGNNNPAPTAVRLIEANWSKLSEESKIELAINGLRGLLCEVIGADRKKDVPKPTKEQVESREKAIKQDRIELARDLGRKLKPELDRALLILQSISLVGASNVMKPLAEFNANDLQYVETDTRNKSVALVARSAWCAEARAALDVANVSKLAELPRDVRTTIAERAAGVWKNAAA